jgi:hypothetical protein
MVKRQHKTVEITANSDLDTSDDDNDKESISSVLLRDNNSSSSSPITNDAPFQTRDSLDRELNAMPSESPKATVVVPLPEISESVLSHLTHVVSS